MVETPTLPIARAHAQQPVAYGQGRYVRHRADLGRAAGSRDLGFRVEHVEPGHADVPLHWHVGEEEGFFGLAGEGVLVQTDERGQEVARAPLRAGDAVVFPPNRRVGHLIEVPDEARVPFRYAVFGERAPVDLAGYPGRNVWLARRGIDGVAGARRDGLGLFAATPVGYYDGLSDAGGREAAGGSARTGDDPTRFGVRGGETTPSPVVTLADVPVRTVGKGPYERGLQRLGPLLGADRLALNIDTIAPGHFDSPFHFHFGDEEWFYILEGEAELRLGGPGWPGGDTTVRLGPGDAASFPGGTGIAHRIGCPADADAPLRTLVLATRAPVDVVRMVDSDKWIVKCDGLSKDQMRAWGYLIMKGRAAEWLEDEPLMPDAAPRTT